MGTTSTPPGDEVAPGVHRFGSRRVNWYAVVADDGVTVVDAGVPAHWGQLEPGLAALGRGLDDVAGLVLTHAHPDHVGFAERLRRTTGAPVFVHDADAAGARGEGTGPPVTDLLVNLWRPAVLRLLVELARGGGASITPVEDPEPFADGDVLDLPGSPRIRHVPGHSPGSCAIHRPDREVLLSGDALATVDIRTGRSRGPQLMSMFNADRARASASLDRLDDLGRVTLLPGHGDSWEGEASEAVATARGR